MSRAYYNENDPFAAEWLRMLILSGLIAEGDVDTRSIEDVTASDIAGYTQCHFFAGIGGWSYALRLAGWPDSRPVWTLSCPCQPFSAAGKGGGISDERHLWPAAHWLIAQRRPITCFGEQVASPAGLSWLDSVQTDFENTAYSTWAADICAAGIGAPHIRQRLYWRADSMFAGRSQRRTIARDRPIAGSSGVEWGSDSEDPLRRRSGRETDAGRGNSEARGCGNVGFPQHSDSSGQYERQSSSGEQSLCYIDNINRDSIATRLQRYGGNERNWDKPGWLSEAQTRSIAATGATRGFWSNCDWWHGRDEKFRPIEPGLFPLAHGVPARMGKLRGFGNAIVPELAAAFIEATEGW